jgi:ribosomal protein S18 acetylase RimI-like enzyme
MISPIIQIHINHSEVGHIANHLRNCDELFLLELTKRVRIDDYALKIQTRAMRFEAWEDGQLIGLVAAYCNDHKLAQAFITSVSVVPRSQGQGIASRLLQRCIVTIGDLKFRRIRLEVKRLNEPAIRLYQKHGFILEMQDNEKVYMNVELSQHLGSAIIMMHQEGKAHL